MSMMTKTSVLALAAGAILGSTAVAYAEGELNLYSSRHYDTDERLYSDFTDATGITITRIEGNADELLARSEAEGANSSRDGSPATFRMRTTSGSASRNGRGSSSTTRPM